MPDLFASLAARMREPAGAAPRIRPRLPHLFERPQPAAPEWLPATGVAATTAPAEPAAAALRRFGDREPTLRLWPAPAQAPAAAPDEAVVRRRTVTEVESVTSVRRVLERIDLPTRPLLVPPPAAIAAPAPPPEPGAPSVTAVAGEPRPAPVIAASRAAAAGRLQPAASEPRRPQPRAERVVRVTIGRLEVRAGGREQPPRPAARPGRPAPQLPLADYLAGEDGRR